MGSSLGYSGHLPLPHGGAHGIPVPSRTNVKGPHRGIGVGPSRPHGTPFRPDQARGFSRISYVEMRSSSWRSLYDPRLMPHSKPSRTSVTSSLKRRSPAISTFSDTTTPLR